MNQIISRRSFLQSTAALAAAHSTAAFALDRLTASSTSIRAYVGTYTGSAGNGEGIYLFEMNRETGKLTNRQLAATSPSPSWLVVHPSKLSLYAVNELDNGTVTAFSIEPSTGALRQLNVVSSGGAGPCYISIDKSGKYALVANYGSGTVAVFPIHADGSLGEATDIQAHHGNIGATHATNAPKGSFAISGHDGPHAHIVLPDPQGNFILATDLGQDRIYTYRLNEATGKLAVETITPMPTGDGPRHLAFHPNGRWLYADTEEASTVTLFDYDARTGSLHARQTISALPAGFAGTSYASEVLVHPSGRWLYIANRLNDTITVFTIAADGMLKQIGEASTLGDYPVQLRIDPTGRFLFACNRKSDAITSFRIDRATGLLRFTGDYTAAGSAASITFSA